MEIVGSYRRGAEISSDIDVIAWHPAYPTKDTFEENKSLGPHPEGLLTLIMRSLFDSGILRRDEALGQGDTKVMALGKLPSEGSVRRQIDIRLCPLESLPFMLVGNTGDDALMRMLRGKARDKGYTLNEYGIASLSGDKLPVQGIKTEEDIFELVSLVRLKAP